VSWISYASLAVAFGSVLLTWACHRCARTRLAEASPAPGAEPPISILRPLCGMDDDLHKNLLALAQQDYPAFEIVLGIADADDPARAVAQRFKAEFPHLAIRIVIDSRCRGYNPKVANLENMLPVAQHEHLLVSDSNVWLEPGFLRSIMADFQRPGTGLVVNLIVGVGERTFAAAVENLHLNSYVLSTMCGARTLCRHTCAVGKSMLFTRASLQAAGGLVGVRDVLAEDYILGQRFEQAGYGVWLSNQVVRTVNGRRGFEQFWNRQVRWAQMRRHLRLDAYLVELLLNPLFWLFPSVWACALARPDHPALASWVGLCALGAFLYKAWADLSLAATVNRKVSWPMGLALLLARDVLMFGVWCVAFFKRSLDWRGNRLTIGPGSALSAPRLEAAILKVEG
jgi:ceramide glucosyltransferase